MSVLQTLTSQLIERVEWKAWLSLHTQRAHLPRLQLFRCAAMNSGSLST